MVWMILAVFSAFCLMLPLPMQARELPSDLPVHDRGRQAVLAGVSEVARSSHAATDASAAVADAWYQGRVSASPVYSATLEETTFLPLVWRAPVTPATAEWTQHAHDAQRTSFAPQSVPTPWRWKWAWNGPNAAGGIASGKFGLPRNSQPVTGGGRVYIAAGSRGVYALNNANGAVIWARNPGGSINSTPAYDPDTDALFVLSSNGTLYKLNAANGVTLAQFVTGSSSDLPLPPAWHGGQVFISMGNRVYAIDKFTMNQAWSYDTGSPVHTPPAYSPSRDVVVVASQDLFVHGINNADGSRRWRVKPTPRVPADAGFTQPNMAEVRNGWPVIAEGHGLALIKYRLDWYALWRLSPWPHTNTAMRAALLSSPGEQALYALRLSDGSSAFIAHVGHGGFGDGGYLPMGPQPVVKRFADGSEVVYTVIRGRLCNPGGSCDGRWDSQLGEMMLDDSTVPGYLAGYVRFIRNTFFPTDEQAYVSMAGDHLFGGHWEAGIAHQITDRSSARGTFANPIQTTDLPHIATSQDQDVCNTGFRASHYCGAGLQNTRPWPGGFYIYWRQGAVYDQYWSEYATWVVSNNTVYFVSTDGAVVALEHGTPPGAGTAMTALPEAEPATGPADTPNMIIPYTQARVYAGRIVAVEGVIAYVFNNGKSVLLGFENPHQGAFKAQILKQDWDAFPAPPDTLYRVGERVRVRGKIEWYQGDPAIYVRAPTQIEADRE